MNQGQKLGVNIFGDIFFTSTFLLFYTKNFAFFTPKFLFFYTTNFAFFTPIFFQFLLDPVGYCRR